MSSSSRTARAQGGRFAPPSRCPGRSCSRARTAPGRSARPRTRDPPIRSWRCSSMNLTSVAMGGRAPPRRKPMRSSRSRSPAAAHGSPLQISRPSTIITGETRLGPGIDLGLLDPAPQRVAVDAKLIRDPAARRRDRQLQIRIHKQILNQTDRPVPQFVRVLLGAGMTPPFRGINASTRPGAIQTGSGPPDPSQAALFCPFVGTKRCLCPAWTISPPLPAPSLEGPALAAANRSRFATPAGRPCGAHNDADEPPTKNGEQQPTAPSASNSCEHHQSRRNTT